MIEKTKSIFSTLNETDISKFLKQKNGMNYLPWSSAWAVIKNLYPNSTYKTIKTPDGCNYHTDGKTCWVETELTIEGETQSEQLAVMNYKNAAIPVDTVTSVDVNKSIKRCFVKNAALFGLGLSLWNGEEISEAARARKTEEKQAEERTIKELKASIIAMAKKMIDAGTDSGAIYSEIEKISGFRNPNSIKDCDVCDKVLEALNNMKEGAVK
jgi:hypothetical protein